MTLTDFILARIAEDERVADRSGSFTPWSETFQNDNHGHLTIQPDRVLAECEAKRRIVEMHSYPAMLCHATHDETATHEDGEPCETLRALALPYAADPDYREEWRP